MTVAKNINAAGVLKIGQRRDLLSASSAVAEAADDAASVVPSCCFCTLERSVAANPPAIKCNTIATTLVVLNP